jgi:hypothetical protein
MVPAAVTIGEEAAAADAEDMEAAADVATKYPGTCTWWIVPKINYL